VLLTTIDQNSNAISLDIDSEATSNTVFQIRAVDASSAYMADFRTNDGLRRVSIGHGATDRMLYVKRNLDSGSTAAAVVEFVQDHATDDQSTLKIQQDGTGYPLHIDNYGTGRSLMMDISGNSKGIYIDSAATTQGTFYSTSDSGQTIVNIGDSRDAQGTNWFFRNLASASSAGPVMFVEQDNSGDDQNALRIQNDGTGDSVFIDTNSNAYSLNIDSEASTAGTVYIASTGTGVSTLINQDGDGIGLQIDTESTTKPGLQILADGIRTGTTSSAALAVRQDHASSTGTASYIQNDGTGISFDIAHNGNSTAVVLVSQASSANGLFLRMDNASATGNAINIDHDGTGIGMFADIDGNATAIQIDSEATGKPLIRFQPIAANTRGDIAFGTARTNDPSGPLEGDIWYNGTDNYLRYYDGSATIDIGGAGAGTVTSVAAGSGLDFTTITSTGSVTMGTPSTTTNATINQVTSTSHTHALDTGISDNKIVQVDSGSVANLEYARFTADGLSSRSYSEVVSDLSLDNVDNTSDATKNAASVTLTNKTISASTLSGDMNASNNTIDNAETVQFNSESDNGSKTANFTVTWNNAQKQKVTLTANTMTMTLGNPTSVGNFLLKIVNGGLATLTWAATSGSVLFPGGTAPTLTSSGTDIISMYYDGTNFYVVESLDFS